jgi:hypothetical protein
LARRCSSNDTAPGGWDTHCAVSKKAEEFSSSTELAHAKAAKAARGGADVVGEGMFFTATPLS